MEKFHKFLIIREQFCENFRDNSPYACKKNYMVKLNFLPLKQQEVV